MLDIDRKRLEGLRSRNRPVDNWPLVMPALGRLKRAAYAGASPRDIAKLERAVDELLG